MAKYDWDKLKAKYIAGNCNNLREFAEKEKINYVVLRRNACKWQNEKLQTRNSKVTKIITKTVEKIVEKESDYNAKHIALFDKLLSKAEIVIDNELTVHVDMFGNAHEGTVIKVDKLEALSRIIEKAQKGHRLALGLDKDKGPMAPDVKPYVDALNGVAAEVWSDE